MSGAAGGWGALQERPFRLFWLAATTSSFGDAISTISLVFAVLSVSSSASTLGAVLAASAVSRAAFVLVGGVWSDRLPRRTVMVWCDWARAVAQCFAGVLVATGAALPWHLAASAFVVGAATSFFVPAATGLLPRTVTPHRLQPANALLSTSDSASWLAGPPVAGAVVAAFGPGAGLLVDAATYALSAAFLMRLRPREKDVGTEPRRFRDDLATGWKEVRSRAWLQAAFVAFAVSNVAVAVFFVLGPVVLGGASGDTDWAIVVTIGAAGGLGGSLVALRFRPRWPLRTSFPAVLPVALALVSLVPPAPVLVVGAAAFAMFAGIQLANALWDTTVQQHIPAAVISRVSSYDWFVSLVFQPIGYAVVGPVADAVGREATLLAAALLATCANSLVLAVPSVRRLRRPEA